MPNWYHLSEVTPRHICTMPILSSIVLTYYTSIIAVPSTGIGITKLGLKFFLIDGRYCEEVWGGVPGESNVIESGASLQQLTMSL